MDNKLISYPRGSVWMCKIEFAANNMKGVQYGVRPAVVISDNSGNVTSPSVMVALITSKDKAGKGINVPFINEYNEENVVLCNQVHTVNIEWLNKYMGIMPNLIMQQVDTALSLAFSITRENVDISPIIEEVNKIISAKTQVIKEVKPVVTQDTVHDIAQQLEKMFKELLIPLDKETRNKIKDVTPIASAYISAKQDNKTETEKKSTLTEKSELVKKARKPKGYWTVERKKEFIKDRALLPLDELKVKYDIESSKSLYQMYYTFKREFERNSETVK